MRTHHMTRAAGYSRPSRNMWELFKRLSELEAANPKLTKTLDAERSRLVRLKQRLEDCKLESKESEGDKEDIACKEKEIKRVENTIIQLNKDLEKSQYHHYEVKQILEKLDRDAETLGLNQHDSALTSDLEEFTQAKPYHVTDKMINEAIGCFEFAKTSPRFTAAAKKIFDDGIIALNHLRLFRTFKHYDLILTGVVIFVMLHEDNQHGPNHPLGGDKFFYPVPLHEYKDSNLIEVGKAALIEKKLPFNGTIHPRLFDFLRDVFPNYLAGFYGLDTNAAKLDTVKRTGKYLKRRDEKKLLKYFKDAYRKEYAYSFFKNPFSKMKLNLADNALTMKEVRAYAKENPNSRSARVLSVMVDRGPQRLKIKAFTDKYLRLYSEKTFRNPFSFMRRKITRLRSTEEIYKYAKNNMRSRSAQVVDEMITKESHVREFLKR
jgi:hypothetical protein